jgi:hypothetical protein
MKTDTQKEYHREASRKWRENNREKHRAYSREYNKANPEAAVIRLSEWKARNPERKKKHASEYRWQSEYGLDFTMDDYNALFTKQEGRCAICQRHQSELRRTLMVDHIHGTKTVRGLLCFDCNTAIGRLGDNLEGVQRAVEYLRNW